MSLSLLFPIHCPSYTGWCSPVFQAVLSCLHTRIWCSLVSGSSSNSLASSIPETVPLDVFRQMFSPWIHRQFGIVTPWSAACQASLSITSSCSLLKLMSIESVVPSNHFISVIPFSSCFQSFPASESFPMSQFFTSGGPSIGLSASTSVLPMNTQEWFPLGWIGWIALQSKGLSRVFSNTTVQKHQFFSTQPSI